MGDQFDHGLWPDEGAQGTVMSLPTLSNIPQTEQAFAEFSFSNYDEHRKIYAAIQRDFAISLQEYIIEPLPLFDFSNWAYRHQLMHNLQNQVLGIAGNDLTSVDFSKPDQLAAFIWLHASEHYQAANILGLT